MQELKDEEAAVLWYDWPLWARDKQLEPPGDWRIWLLLAGRGWGKTRVGAEWIRSRVESGRCGRIALVAKMASEYRDVMVEGESGIMAISAPWFRPIWQPSKRRLTWPNGAIATCYSAEDPDQLRGPQHDCFVAGTMIATPDGDCPIETIKIGDWVLTRRGSRRVTNTRSKLDSVGRVVFSNGVELIGTSQHPVLELHGWTTLAKLNTGDSVCIGNRLQTVTSRPMPTGKRFTSTDGCGSSKTALSQKDLRFITGTKIRPITIRQIWNWCRNQSTALLMSRQPVCNLSTVKIAGSRCKDSNRIGAPRSVATASGSALSKSERRLESAGIAGRSFPLAGVTSVVSVASIWEPVGAMTVHDLTVEDQHEYFANGIVVHNCAWADEPAKWRYADETWANLMLGLRLGSDPRAVATTTPRPTKLIKSLIAERGTHITRGSTYDNRANLAPAFFDQIIGRYEGTRLGRQELEAELLEDIEGALWTHATIDRARVREAPELSKVGVAIDPAVTAGEGSNETGIIAGGVGLCRCSGRPEQHVFILDDLSGVFSPDVWANRAIRAYAERRADRVIGEVNNGGDLIEHTLRTVDRHVSYVGVRASRGKYTRAEPVAALFEQGKVHFVGLHPELEDQLTTWVPGEDSPDRLDALVWLIWWLMLAGKDKTLRSF